MKLEWEDFVGPGTEKAYGFGGIFLAYHKEKVTTLYLMRHGIPLCPVNKERAEKVVECASPEEAYRLAQKWEDKIVANAHIIFGHITE